jgi:4-amino-4-deoxy-L-arabinose transferase-like glycosyltransferase
VETLERPDQGVSRARLARLALGPVVAVAGSVAALLAGLSGRYGYHRDELYTLAASRHLAWGYPDQPPLVALLARSLSLVAPGSVAVLRLPSALAVAAIVVLTALVTRELGGQRTAQTLAATSMAVAPLLLGAGHLLSTTTYDMLAWALLLWLVVRVLRTGDRRLLVVCGAVAGIGLLNKDLVASLLAALVAGIAVAGPRRLLASRWLWIGGAVAAALWAPYLAWQARHGWPQWQVARAVAEGSSGSSQPRALFLPEQLGLISPYLAPIWIAGLVRLFRDPALRCCRAIGWAYLLLAALFVVLGGKPYYLGGFFPMLLAAGAQPTVDWVRSRRPRLRRTVLGAALVLTATSSVLITLPVLPLGALHRTPIVAVNYDTGETIAWPTYVQQIAGVFRELPAGRQATAAIVTSNYGEAGAIDRYGRALGLPSVYSGHNGYWYWGPPPATADTVVAVGFDRDFLRRSFGDVRLATRLDNHLRIVNDEQGAAVWVCSRPRDSWPALWPRFRSLG